MRWRSALDSNFNNNRGGNSVPPAAPAAEPQVPLAPAGNGAPPIAGTGAPPIAGAGVPPIAGTSVPAIPVADAKAPLSAAAVRFHSCRWRKAAENGGAPDHCTHRDVLPMAGTTGFVPESWCSDCGYFKAKRSPRKRPEEGQQDDWRRW